MDLNVEKIHNHLVDTQLPSSLEYLKNPTKDFVVSLITAFLTRFGVDVSVINMPRMEQQEVMTCFENSDIIGLINLYVVTRRIGEQLYLNDVCITDITGPGSKRTRRLGQILANFMLYISNAEAEIEDSLNEIHLRSIRLKELLQKKNEVTEAINAKALSNSDQLMLKEKLENEIEKVQRQITKNKQKKLDLDNERAVIEAKRQEVLEHHAALKLQALKISERVASLRLEVVTSSEEHQARLHKLQEEREAMIRERERMQEIFREKKSSVEQFEKILIFMEKQYKKFHQVKDLSTQLMNANIHSEGVNKQIQSIRDNISELESVKNTYSHCEGTKCDVVSAQHEKHLLSIKQLHSQLLSDKKAIEEKSAIDHSRERNAWREKEIMEDLINKAEQQTSSLLTLCQKVYNNEVTKETDWWEIVETRSQ